MSRSKKIIGLVLAVVLVLGSLTMAFAATDPGEGNRTATVAITPDAANIAAGESTTVRVTVNTNFTVGVLSLPLFYEKANVTVSGVPADGNGFTYSTDADVDAERIFASAGLDAATYGFVMVTYIPAADSVTRVFENETVLTFTVTAKDGADGAVKFMTADASRKTAINPTGTLYVGVIDSDTIDRVPTNVEATGLVTDATITIGSAAAPELQLSEYGVAMGAVIDRASACNDGVGFVYGIDTDYGESIEDYLTTPAGSIRVTGNAFGVFSTGAIIELLDASDAVVETYYFVFFGDINGDGLVEPTDLTMVDGIANYYDFDFMVDDGTVESMAMDVNGDGLIEPTDLTIVDGIANYYDYPTQAELAAVVTANKGIA